MPPSALKSALDDLRNLQEFIARAAPPAPGDKSRKRKRPRLERGQSVWVENVGTSEEPRAHSDAIAGFGPRLDCT